ncbi:two-component system response regulator [candidate division KSB1 bacterium 4572_119]|nr:MAG: two-component system response regulator [candidate division KSB1 bacterium 4572_119]
MKKILLVEDNEENRYLISFILEKNGYEVIIAENGQTGFEMALGEKPDLILMDIQLPDINGLEVTKKIRTSKINGSIPIIAITSYAMIGDREKALEAGCNGYIEKPINPETFMNELKKFI